MKMIKLNLVVVLSVVLHGVVLQNSVCDGSKRYHRYLAHIFNTYGNGGSMPFEGLEHLMHNLGLGGQEFNPTHTIEEHRPDGYKMPQFVFEEDVLQTEIKKHDKKNDSKVSNLQMENDIAKTKQKIVPEDESLDRSLQNLEGKIDNSDDGLTRNQQTFKEMHDPKHRHPRHHDKKSASARKCLSPMAMMKLVMDIDALSNSNQKLNYKVDGESGRNKRHVPKTNYDASTSEEEEEEEEELQVLHSTPITPLAFMEMCPALLVQIDQGACAQRLNHVGVNDRLEIRYAYAWIYSTIAVLIISCCGLFGVAIIPLAKSKAYDEILKFLVAIAVGTLCGDALMHLLPHALLSHEDDGEETGDDLKSNERDFILLCACAFFTTIIMYSLEILLPLLKGPGTHTHSHNHSHHQHNQHQPPKVEVLNNAIVLSHIENAQPTNSSSAEVKEINIMLEETQTDKKGTFNLSTVAFMVVLGDGIHNITDGMAIGAAFATDPITGMATAFAVLCHELPHELGDFALLLKTGVTIQKALLLNIGSSILSFLGMAVGLLVAGLHTDMVRWIYASTAGSFLYIALTDLIPEIKNTEEHSVKGCLVQIGGIIVGGGIMLLIALNEDQLRILFE